jgi:GTP cyclohydrolase I
MKLAEDIQTLARVGENRALKVSPMRAVEAVRVLLDYIDPDSMRSGLAETPHRVVKAWGEWAKGYEQDPAQILKTFEDGADGVDEMVLVGPIPFYSHCEHHMTPFFGEAWVGYIPDGKIVGLSKFARLVDCFAKRLQVQERITVQVADAIMHHLNPKGVGVVVKARHMCMESRGVCKAGTKTTSSALRGVMKDAAPRAEFMSFVQK